MPPLFISSEKRVSVVPPCLHFLDTENWNHLALKTVERVILPLPVALLFLSYLSIFRCPDPDEHWSTRWLAYSNNYGTAVHDELLELLFYLPSYYECNAVAQMNPLFLWVLNPWKGIVFTLSTSELLHSWHVVSVSNVICVDLLLTDYFI